MARTVTRYTCRQYCTDRKTRVQSHQLHSKLPSWRIELFFPRCPSHAGGIRWSQDLKETQSVSEAEKKTRQAIFKLAGSWSKRNGPWADVRDLFANSFIRLKIVCLMESWGKFFSCWKLPAVWWWAGRTLCVILELYLLWPNHKRAEAHCKLSWCFPQQTLLHAQLSHHSISFI